MLRLSPSCLLCLVLACADASPAQQLGANPDAERAGSSAQERRDAAENGNAISPPQAASENTNDDGSPPEAPATLGDEGAADGPGPARGDEGAAAGAGFPEGAPPQEGDAGTVDAGPALDCAFSGAPRIEPSDAEIARTQRFTLEGISPLPEGCLRWSSMPDSFPLYGTSERDPVELDPTTGELRVSNIPNNTPLTIRASIEGEVIAMTTVRYFDPSRLVRGIFAETAVLRCPDHVEVPRNEVGEIIFDGELSVTFAPFESYVDIHGRYTWMPTTADGREAALELVVDDYPAFLDPQWLDTSGTFIAHEDGSFELRDIWLGPDEPQCGHVLRRVP